MEFLNLRLSSCIQCILRNDFSSSLASSPSPAHHISCCSNTAKEVVNAIDQLIVSFKVNWHENWSEFSPGYFALFPPAFSWHNCRNYRNPPPFKNAFKFDQEREVLTFENWQLYKNVNFTLVPPYSLHIPHICPSSSWSLVHLRPSLESCLLECRNSETGSGFCWCIVLQGNGSEFADPESLKKVYLKYLARLKFNW